VEFRKRAKVDKSLPLRKGSGRLGLDDDGIDEDGHYDETRDRNELKRLKKEYPKVYEEFRKKLKEKNHE